MESKLQVRDLTISFRTSNGKVQAVRGINFDLAKGETLAIVGESGSGKSVTSKAILGILAGNAIVEGGEIIYDGQDLLKITEEDFHRIRGDKIAMIFQDPMSSLNPIVKIGRQLTEAMILKGKAHQRECRSTFNTYLKHLNEYMIQAAQKEGRSAADQLTEKCHNFDKFEYKHLDLEGAYNEAYDAAFEAVDEIEGLTFEMEKNAAKDVPFRISQILQYAKKSVQEYVVKEQANTLNQTISELSGKKSQYKKNPNDPDTLKLLKKLQEIIQKALELPVPNFFAMGYYKTFAQQEMPAKSVEELNAYLEDYLNQHFMENFIEDAQKGMAYAAKVSYQKKEEAIKVLREKLPIFEKEHLVASECHEAHKALVEKVKSTINPLEIVKDSLSYTFESGMKNELDKYFSSIGKNKKEQEKYNKAKAKHDRLTQKGKKPDWEVAAAQITDLKLVQKNIIRQITRLIEHYEDSLTHQEARDYHQETLDAIDYLKENASGVVDKVTKQVAKTKAIKLMEEVGISEPRKRYNQYPFEFSGGMRQRIVIAIALAANPDILICDEPTTALDVTIQSQILELINQLKRERKLSIIFITHDLGVVANMADRIAVMYAGKIVEYGTAEDVFYHSAHPYTWALLSSMPDLDTNEKLEAIPGTPPNMIYPPVGDAFAPRNKYAMKIDFERQPPMFKITDTHYAATWLLHPDAPKVETPKIITDRIARMKIRGRAQDAE